ncbi:MAG: hypothetical protein Q9168_007617 [Polycauliona sp. 1 TL-2023]
MDQSQPVDTSPAESSVTRLPSTGISLDRLPAELQHAVFASIEKGDVPNLRLTCKSLADVGRDYLVSEMELLFTRQSFDRLSNIVKHMGYHVKSFTYHVDLLKQYRDQDEYEIDVACDTADEPFTDDQLEIGWNLHINLLSQQARLIDAYYGNPKLWP